VRPQARVYMCFISPGGHRSAKKMEKFAFLNRLCKLTPREPRLIYVNVFYSGRFKTRNLSAAKNRPCALGPTDAPCCKVRNTFMDCCSGGTTRLESVRSTSCWRVPSTAHCHHVTSLFMSMPLILGQQGGIKSRTWRFFSFPNLGGSLEVTCGWGRISHVS